MGSVFRGYQDDLDREVAIKLIPLDGPDSRRRFEREAKAMGRLSEHPGILTIYSRGITESGDGYIVMPLIESGSLQTRLQREGPMEWEEAASLVAKIADAVDFAHRRGVAHNDLKPANVLLDERRNPLIADFGLARIRDATSTATATSSDSWLTPAFAAPELINGARPSPAMDVYALGALLFCALSGRPPFTGLEEDPSVGTLLDRVFADDVEDLRPSGIPDAVCDLVEQALSKSPSDRPSTAALLAMRLRALLPDDQGHPGTTQRPNRARPVLAVGGALTLLAAGAILFAMAQSDTPDAETSATTVGPPSTKPTTVTTTQPALEVHPIEPAPAEPTPEEAPDDVDDTVELRLGGAISDPVSAGGYLWVVREKEDGSGSLIQIDPEETSVVSTLTVGANPQQPTVDGDRLWISSRGDGTVSLVELDTAGAPSLALVVDVGATPYSEDSTLERRNPAPILIENRLFVPRNDGSVAVVDTATRTKEATYALGERVVDLVEWQDDVWVSVLGSCGSFSCAELHRVDGVGDGVVDVVRFGSRVLEVWGMTPLEGSMLGFGSGGGIFTLSESDSSVTTIGSVEADLGAAATTDEWVWMTVPSAGHILRSSYDFELAESINVGQSVGVPALSGKLVLAPDPVGGDLVVIDGPSGAIVNTFSVGRGAGKPLVIGDDVWISSAGQVTHLVNALEPSER